MGRKLGLDIRRLLAGFCASGCLKQGFDIGPDCIEFFDGFGDRPALQVGEVWRLSGNANTLHDIMLR